MTTALPAVDTYVRINFGAKASQVGFVEGHTSTGRVKVRAWNATKGVWMPNTRTLDADAIIGPAERGHPVIR